MKKVLSVVIALLLVFCLAACGNDTPNTPNTPNNDNKAADGTVTAPEGYPSKTIEFIVPAAAGAALDLYTRAFNEALDLGTPLRITNMPGGSQTIGLMELGNRKADGYSIGITAFAGMIIQPQLVDVTYTIDSFRPVAISSGPNCYTVCTKYGSAIQDYDALLAAIQSGDKINWTSPNAGSPAHLAGLYLLKQLGAENCEYVSYNGAAEALTALLSGDVTFLITDDSVVATRQADQQVTGIVTLSDGRSQILPDVMSIDEQGITGMSVFNGYSWVVVPKDTPDDVYNWIKQQVDAAVTSESYQAFLKQNNFIEMRTYTEEEMNEMFHNSYNAIAEVVGMLK